MARLDFNIGEIVTRLRALKVRSRVPLSADDQALITVKGFDATRAGYRYSERKAFAHARELGVAGRFTFFRVTNRSPLTTGTTGAPVLAVIEDLHLELNNGAAGTFVPVLMRFELAGSTGQEPFRSTELLDYSQPLPDVGGQVFPPTIPSLSLEFGNQVAPIISAGNDIYSVAGWPARLNTSVPTGIRERDWDLMLPPNTSLFIGLLTANQDADLNVRVRVIE